jgi:lantibiotic modifying enzyme
MLHPKTNFFLKQIADIATAGLPIDDLSLYDGKSGNILFLFHYWKYTGQPFYRDYANNLLDQVSDNIHLVHSPGFLDGVTGIGWTIEYLARNGFIDVQTDEVLDELDEVIFTARFQRYVVDHDNIDMFGYGLYFLSRFDQHRQCSADASMTLKKQALLFLMDECDKMLTFNKNGVLLHPNALASIGYFVMRIQELGIYPGKTRALLKRLSSQFESSRFPFSDPADKFLLMQINNIIEGRNNIQDNHLHTTTMNPIIESCKVALHQLIYSPYYKSDSRFIKEVFPLLDQKDNLKWFRHPSGAYNLSLNNGIAGIGLALLSSVM